MAGPQHAQRQRQEQQLLSITEQLNARRDGRYLFQNPDHIETMHQQQVWQETERQRELYDMGVAEDVQLVAAPQQAPQQVPPVSQLSDRQRRKIADKRMNNLNKAQKKDMLGATADTLPMLSAIQKASKQYTSHPPKGDELYDYNLDARLFSPDFPEEQECSIDVAKAFKTLAKLRLSVQAYPNDVHRHTQETDVTMKVNERLIAPLENALYLVLAANGVDMRTGKPITSPVEVDRARRHRAEAIAAYEKVMASIPQMRAEEAEKYLARHVDQEEKRLEQDDDQQRAEETMDLDFVFHDQALEAEYIQLRHTIDAHPEEYAAHRQVINVFYKWYLDANRQMAVYSRRSIALKNQADGQAAEGQVRAWLRDRARDLLQSPEMAHLKTIAAQQREAILFLVEGRPFSDEFYYMYRTLSREYGIETEMRQKEIEERDMVANLTAYQKRVYEKVPIEQRQRAVRVVRELHQTIKEKVASLNYLREQIKGSNMDLRALKIFWKGHRTDEHGEPIDMQQQENRDSDAMFTRIYLTHDPVLTKRLLQPIIQQMLDFPNLYQDWEKAFWEHPAEVYEAVNRNVYFQHVMEDHPEVFSDLPQEVLDKLDFSLVLGANMSTFLNAIACANGFQFNLGEWLDDESAIEMGKDQVEASRQIVKRLLEQARS